jgi:hydroxylamine reductase
MFCYQCEGTMRDSGIEGCNAQIGACGKTEKTADLQDLLLFAMTGLSSYAVVAKQHGVEKLDVDSFMVEAVFSTLTNVNFDAQRIESYLRETVTMRDSLKARITAHAGRQGISIELPQVAATQYTPAATTAGLLDQALEIGFDMRMLNKGEDIAGMYAFVLYGIKGAAAYADHARMLNNPPQAAYDSLHESMAFLARESDNIDEYVEYALKVGNANFAAMEALDHGHVGKYGHPEPTKVRVSPVAGKCILVSGHDLHDLEAILQQTVGKGINVYTHGELLPANAYPELKKYPHLVGNFGGAWHEQKVEFSRFPGAIVLTSNCLIEPQVAYQERIFSTNAVGWSGVKHILSQDFSQVIEAALTATGFTNDAPEKIITIGFARNAVLSVADTVVNAVKSGAIKHFYLVGGCDVPTSHGDYYGDFARNTPKDSIVLTLGCAKYRFNQDDLGDIGGIPRVLDMGQCNDAYSAVQVALTLANAFDCSVNELPLTLVVSWFEQKAVAIMLTLLALGLENVLWGPLLPAFATPKILELLESKFKLTPITNVSDDMAKTLH